MAKFNIMKGDLIWARSVSLFDEYEGRPINGHMPYDRPLQVIKVWKHGVKTRERGYINNNNILAKIT